MCGSVMFSPLNQRHLSESSQAVLESSGSKGECFYIIFFCRGWVHHLNVWLPGALGIYNGPIIYEMWLQANNVIHVPTVNNKNQEM